MARAVRQKNLVLIAVATQCLLACASANVGLQKDGTYLLARTEESMDCQRLYQNIWGRVQIMKGLPARAKTERQATASTALQVWWRAWGAPSKSLPAAEEFDRERAHVYALHAAMQNKNCPLIDLERELMPSILAMDEVRQN